MSSKVPIAEMEGYILTAQQQKQQRQDHLQQRRSLGLATAKQAAERLKQMGAAGVVLFGSLMISQSRYWR